MVLVGWCLTVLLILLFLFMVSSFFFFFNDTATTEIYTLSLHDALPISGRSRRLPAIWNVASAEGLRVGVVGWWATHPAEEVNGFFVSDRASSILFEGSRDSLAYPPALGAGVGQVIESEGRISDDELTAYVAMSAAGIAGERAKGGG